LDSSCPPGEEKWSATGRTEEDLMRSEEFTRVTTKLVIKVQMLSEP